MILSTEVVLVNPADYSGARLMRCLFMTDNSARAQFYKSYWEGLKKFAELSAPDFLVHNPILSRHYLHFPCNVPYVHFALNAPKTKLIRCELVLDNTRARNLLLKILEYRESLTADDLQVNLKYVTCAYDQKPRRFYVQHRDLTSGDPKTRDAQYKWMLDMLGRFQGYFSRLMDDLYKIFEKNYN